MAVDISKRIARFIEPFRVNPGSSVKLGRDFDPGSPALPVTPAEGAR